MAASTIIGPRPAVDRRSGFHTLTVAAVEPLCDDAVAVTFDVPPELAATFDFRAGQSLTLRRDVDGREERRSYSICAPEGARPRIGVREIPDGVFSSWLVHEVRPGDEVEVQPPTGRFCPDPTYLQGGRHLCVAAGSGITPVLSLVRTVLAHPSASVTLLYGNRTSASVMFAEELADLKNAHGPALQLVHVLSREPRDVELFSGRLDRERLQRLLSALTPGSLRGWYDHAWLCGPFEMTTAAREVLTGTGMPPARVHLELFYVDEPPPEVHRAGPAVGGVGGATSEVTVVLDGTSTVVPVPRDTTVLDAAGTVRSDLPFACKGGVCGTCRARVTDGEVDMRRNYALDEDELSRGYVLTCQSRPVTDTVTVDFDT